MPPRPKPERELGEADGECHLMANLRAYREAHDSSGADALLDRAVRTHADARDHDYMTLLAKVERLRNFLLDLRHPEAYGHAVTQEVRQLAARLYAETAS